MSYKALDEYPEQAARTETPTEPTAQHKYHAVKFYKETQFQETPIGKIPKEWKIVRLKEIIKYKKGKKPQKLFDVRENSELIPYLTAEYMRNIGQPKWCLPNDTNIVKVDKNDIIMIWDGSYAGHVFTGFEGALASTMIKIEPKALVYPKFLYYYLSKHFNVFRDTTVGTGIPHINKSVFENFLIPLPPLEEQQGIAEVFSSIDNAIEITQKLVEKLKKLKQGLMQELLTKGIGHREFKETEIGKVPKEWSVVRLENISSAIYYGVTAKAVDKNTGIRMLRTTDIKDYKVNWDSLPYCEITSKVNSIEKYLLKKGDIIVARAGTVGVSVLVDRDFDNVVFGSYLIKIRPRENFIHPRFLHYYFQSSQYWKHISKAQGSTLKNINLDILKSLPVPLPPLEEQQKIAEILSVVDELINVEERRREKLERIKLRLMDLLLTGQVRVVVNG